MALLIQFLLRLSFGLATGMAITSSKQVTSGYFRNHLYVTLGLTSLAALLSHSAAPESFWYAVGAAGGSYLGSVYWLFEKPGPGKLMLLIVAMAAWLGASNQTIYPPDTNTKTTTNALDSRAPVSETISVKRGPSFLSRASVFSSSQLLGMTMAAMLLGHWYLNSPTMEMAPLRRLILLMATAVALRTLVASLGLWGELAHAESLPTQWLAFLALRWTFGLLGVAILTWMAWQTLKIPNTQSATGILYVAVIGTFVGETMALLLSTESLFPL